jgi:predicted GIY-YIG superfamily endonuclease
MTTVTLSAARAHGIVGAVLQLTECNLGSGLLFKMCLQAVLEGDGALPGDPEVLLPLDLEAFIALARRSGVDQNYSYRLYKKWARAHGLSGMARVPANTVKIDFNHGRTGLYRLFDASRALLYIGISDALRDRMAGHAATQPWWHEVAHRTVVWYDDREAADAAETLAIAAEKPRYNKAKVYGAPAGSEF